MDANVFIEQNLWWLIILFVWSTCWKGWALWRAAKLDQKVWFVVFMVVNTVGILEIFYLFYFSKQKNTNSKPQK